MIMLMIGHIYKINLFVLIMVTLLIQMILMSP